MTLGERDVKRRASDRVMYQGVEYAATVSSYEQDDPFDNEPGGRKEQRSFTLEIFNEDFETLPKTTTKVTWLNYDGKGNNVTLSVVSITEQDNIATTYQVEKIR